MKKSHMPAAGCWCGRPAAAGACCGRFLDAGVPAPTAEALMRSRYSAYVTRNEPYLLATWHASTRPSALDLAEDDGTRWIGLDIKRAERGAEGDDDGVVEFVARYKVGGRAYRLHEVSRFVREDGRWYYVDGEVSA